MTEYSFYPPENSSYTLDLMMDLADLIIYVRSNVSDLHSIPHPIEYYQKLSKTFDSQTMDILFKLNGLQALDGKVHIYANREASTPTVTILSKPLFFKVVRNVQGLS